jgi:hypothetical protein
MNSFSIPNLDKYDRKIIVVPITAINKAAIQRYTIYLRQKITEKPRPPRFPIIWLFFHHLFPGLINRVTSAGFFHLPLTWPVNYTSIFDLVSGRLVRKMGKMLRNCKKVLEDCNPS